MRIIEKRYAYGTVQEEGYIAIPELNRVKPSTLQFIKLMDLSIVVNKPTAFIYVDGFSTAQAESCLNTLHGDSYIPMIKSGSSYSMHEWIRSIKGNENIKYAEVVSSTCASGIQALYRAEQLLHEGMCQEVIIIGSERTTEATIKLAKELQIPITCGDGFVYLRLDSKDSDIVDIKWKYKYNSNPFVFTRETINTLIPKYKIDYVKLHGTGTEANTEAERDIAKTGKNLIYKSRIGHTQGISSLLETCLVLDNNNIQGIILVTANGFGGYYGSFTLIK